MDDNFKLPANILYVYATVIKQDDGGLEEEEDEIDIYYWYNYSILSY